MNRRSNIAAALAIGLAAAAGAGLAIHKAPAAPQPLASMAPAPIMSRVRGRHALSVTRVAGTDCAEACKATYHCGDVAEPDQEKCIHWEVECILRCDDPQPGAPPDDPDPNHPGRRI